MGRYDEPVSFSPEAVKKNYKAVAQYSFERGTPLTDIGPQAISYLVDFWDFLAPEFKKLFVEQNEYHYMSQKWYQDMTQAERDDFLNKKWTEYCKKHEILQEENSWIYFRK